MVPPSEYLVNIWIIEKDSGLCFFEQSFKDININADLISGFFMALLSFGKEVAEKDLKSLDFGGLKFFFKYYDRFIIVIAVDENASDSDADNLLNLLGDEFEKRYGDILLNWNGSAEIFNEFGEYIEELVDKKSLKLELIKNHILKLKEEKVDKHREALLNYARSIFDNLMDRKKELKKELESKITGLYLKFKEKLSK